MLWVVMSASPLGPVFAFLVAVHPASWLLGACSKKGSAVRWPERGEGGHSAQPRTSALVMELGALCFLQG